MLFMGLTEYANKAYELEQSTIHVLQNSAIAAVIKVRVQRRAAADRRLYGRRRDGLGRGVCVLFYHHLRAGAGGGDSLFRVAPGEPWRAS